MEVQAAGFGLSYQWRRNGEEIPGATNASLRLSEIRFEDSGDYSVMVCNPAGCVTTNFGHLTVRSDPKPGTAVSWGMANPNGFFPYVGQEQIPAGLGEATAVSSAYNASIALLSDGTVQTWGEFLTGRLTPTPAGLNGVIMVDASGEHFVVLRSDGTVVSWGRNQWGECNVPSNLTSVVAVAAGGGFSAALRKDGSLVTWGLTSTITHPGTPGIRKIAANGGPLVLLQNDGSVHVSGFNGTIAMSNIVDIAVGGTQMLGLDSSGRVQAWGAGATDVGFYPELGQSIVPEGLDNVSAIAVGEAFSLALKSDGTIVGWGKIYRWSDQALFEPSAPLNLPGAFFIEAGNNFAVALVGPRPLIPVRHRVVANTIEVSWPLSAAGRSLETAARLDSPKWNRLEGESVNAEGWIYQSAPLTDAAQFFRLASP